MIVFYFLFYIFMKPLYILLFLLFSTSYTLAQDIPTTTVSADINALAFAQQSAALQSIEVNFCDHYGDKAITYPVYLGQSQKICLNVFNGSTSDVSINLGFVDGMLTNDQRKNRACGLSDDIDAFGQYVTWYKSKVTLSSNTSQKIYAKVLYPKQLKNMLSWSTIEWCLVYSLDNSATSGHTLGFWVLVRKAKFISLNIKTESKFIFRPCVLLLFPILLVVSIVYTKRKSKRI